MNNWIDVNEQLPPEEGGAVIVAIKGYVRPTIAFYEDGQWCIDGEEEPLDEAEWQVTHWWPLQEMPKYF